jgi:hypothetical protein
MTVMRSLSGVSVAVLLSAPAASSRLQDGMAAYDRKD